MKFSDIEFIYKPICGIVIMNSYVVFITGNNFKEEKHAVPYIGLGIYCFHCLDSNR